MKYKETFLSTDGRTEILSYWYVPENPKAVLRLCHGMSEHLARPGYDAFASFLEENGYAVCGHDYIGHGGSAGRKDLGFFGEKDGWQFLLGDVKKLGELAEEKIPGVPQALFGHSMGSLIAREYLAMYPGEAVCAVIMGTLGPMPAGAVPVLLAKTVAAFGGARGFSKLLYNMSFGSYLNRIPQPVSQFDWLSRDAEAVAAYDADPLCGFMFTNAAMVDLMKIYHSVSKSDWAGRLDKDTPIMFLSGAEDPCGSYGKGVEEIYARTLRAGVKDSTMKLYEGARHELLNELNKQEVYKDILAFLERTAVRREG